MTDSVIGFIQSFVDDQVAEEAEAPVELTLELKESSHPLVYDPHNERLKLYGVSPLDLIEEAFPDSADPLVSKVTAYAKAGEMARWERLGFRKEGIIRGFFVDGDAHLWAAYPDDDADRKDSDRELIHRRAVQVALAKDNVEEPTLSPGFRCRVATECDAPEISRLMTATFPDYPSPIEAELVRDQILTRSNHFRVVHRSDNLLAAVASAELDHERKSAEMTDCATHPDCRGMGLMLYLLRQLEDDTREFYGIHDLYSLARADEVGINCVFSKLGYDYSGRLVNNCRMPNGWESMNVWCKHANE